MNLERVDRLSRRFALHGWLGIALIGIFWTINWSLSGLRTQWIFFPLWLGYCLFVDALVLSRKGSSLITRSWRKYIGLFLVSAPVWWIFELINGRLQNWIYEGSEYISPFVFSLWETLSFTTVIPAVFGTAELVGTFSFIQKIRPGPVIKSDRPTTRMFFIAGCLMFTLMWVFPHLFFPFMWISIYCIMEPVNVWLGNRSLANWTARGDWRPVITLWLGVLVTAFFWEMWNYLSYPKWVYHVPWGQFWHIFEMPLLGYIGYLPFALELFAMYHFVVGFLGGKRSEYVELCPAL